MEKSDLEANARRWVYYKSHLPDNIRRRIDEVIDIKIKKENKEDEVKRVSR